MKETDVSPPDAVAAADAAATRAGVRIRELSSVEELTAAVGVLSTIWGRESSNPAVPPELLRALAKAGNYVTGAFDGTELVGVAIAFHSSPTTHTLHSHIVGVVSSHLGRAIGYAMKMHQRAWALARGITVIEWTFDPLVARNAYFNIVKLGAMPVEYLVNFYGVMLDVVNGDDETDRLLVRWQLLSPDAVGAAGGDRTAQLADGASDATVVIPSDIESLRRTDPRVAKEWRSSVRDELTTLLSEGGRIVGFEPGVGYLIRRTGD